MGRGGEVQAVSVALASLSQFGTFASTVPEGVVVRGVQHDSRRVGPGDLFVAIAGNNVDGAQFIAQAQDNGAVAVAIQEARQASISSLSIPTLLVPNTRAALGPLAHHVYGKPTDQLRVVGITGTNGKTTTAWLVHAILKAAGKSPALLGTIGSDLNLNLPALTTPEADDIHRAAAQAVKQGRDHLVMEVSSHALALHRVDGIQFDVAAFTNLSNDHLDFHGSMEAYRQAKARLFEPQRFRCAAIATDDKVGQEWFDGLAAQGLQTAHYGGPLWSCGSHHDGEAFVVVEPEMNGELPSELSLWVGGDEYCFVSSLFGAHNHQNMAVAAGVGLALGLDPATVVQGLTHLAQVPGRMEAIDDPRGVHVFVDYAHTPDALRAALHACRGQLGPEGKLWAVFGAGGDRDHSKRAVMGRVAGKAADVLVLTDDNPRSEDPTAILEHIAQGVKEAGIHLAVGELTRDNGAWIQPDRCRAIARAIQRAQPGDVVLIAGKGHETQQISAAGPKHFDDREQARTAIAAATSTPVRGGAP